MCRVREGKRGRDACVECECTRTTECVLGMKCS